MGLDWSFTLLSFPQISIIADIYVGSVPRTSGTCRNQWKNNTELVGGLRKVAAGLCAFKYTARQQASKPNGCLNRLGGPLLNFKTLVKYQDEKRMKPFLQEGHSCEGAPGQQAADPPELGACWMGDRPGVNPLCACVTSGKFLNVSESQHYRL